MICIVSGFQSKISALQFEHAWQHAYQTRHIPADARVVKNRSGAYGNVHKYLANMRLLLKAPAFKRAPLQVHLFEETARDAWELNKFQIPVDTPVLEDLRINEEELIGGGQSLPKKQRAEDEHLKKSIDLVKESPSRLIAVCPCPECTFHEPLVELSKRCFVEQNQLIPIKVTCPECNSSIAWGELVTNAKNIRDHFSDD
jgi:structure-specific endonuclease subunit SLX1